MPNMVAPEVSQKKRKLAGSAGKSSAQKRRKAGSSSHAPPANKTKRVVSADALQWRSVEVPEMFDDAEGFFGLEEVEGVDVVRDGNTVQFVCSGARPSPRCVGRMQETDIGVGGCRLLPER